MPTGVYNRKPLSEKHKENISKALSGKQPKNSINWKGKNHPNFGKKSSLESRLKMSASHKNKGYFIPSRKGCHNSIKQNKIVSEKLRGSLSYNWKGGQGIKRQVRDSYKYREWRKRVFERDDFTCQNCQKRGVYLEAHHTINKFSDLIRKNNITTIEMAFDNKELWDINNGLTLCFNCHNMTKGK